MWDGRIDLAAVALIVKTANHSQKDEFGTPRGPADRLEGTTFFASGKSLHRHRNCKPATNEEGISAVITRAGNDRQAKI